MENAPKQKGQQALTRLLRRINQGADPKLLRKEANRLITSIGPKEIAVAEQNLIADGLSAKLVQELSAAFVLMGILEGQGDNLKNRLPDNHLLKKIMAEHDLLRCFMADLKDVEKAIQNKDLLTDTCLEFRKLAHIIEHLNAMEEHIEREEDVIFPFLKKHGWNTLCRSARSEHVYIKIAINDLVRLIGTFRRDRQKEFKSRLSSIIKYLHPTITEHLFQEDNILYPVALEVIEDKDLWEKVKNLCDEIGYCGVHI